MGACVGGGREGGYVCCAMLVLVTALCVSGFVPGVHRLSCLVAPVPCPVSYCAYQQSIEGRVKAAATPVLLLLGLSVVKTRTPTASDAILSLPSTYTPHSRASNTPPPRPQAPLSARVCVSACTRPPPRSPTLPTAQWPRCPSAAATRCWHTYRGRDTTCR